MDIVEALLTTRHASAILGGLSIFRGMPAGSDPSAACLHDRQIIHLQRRHRRPTAGRQAHNLRVTITPGEMIVPILLQGMEQGDNFARLGIYACLLYTFVDVAGETSQT